ncbi:MAG: polyphosphate kinase 2 family protein [Candidatus Limnocylindrales bacterium]
MPAARSLRQQLMVTPGSQVDLTSIDPAATRGRSKPAAEKEITAGLLRLSVLQDRLWAEAKRAVLIVVQGIDAAGKDGTIKHVMGAFNPQGCPVTAFKVPSAEELAHDYLWRVHARVPAKGEIGIFNRSHYEEVLVVRVHELLPKAVWSKRYAQLNDFEALLSSNGTTIVKLFLHISREEQRVRFQSRYADPSKRWKFKMGDLEERKHWDDYQAAFEDMLAKTSTKVAPWYVIPANRNWFRNLAVTEILGDVLEDLDPRYPEPAGLPPNLVIE